MLFPKDIICTKLYIFKGMIFMYGVIAFVMIPNIKNTIKTSLIICIWQASSMHGVVLHLNLVQLLSVWFFQTWDLFLHPLDQKVCVLSLLPQVFDIAIITRFQLLYKHTVLFTRAMEFELFVLSRKFVWTCFRSLISLFLSSVIWLQSCCWLFKASLRSSGVCFILASVHLWVISSYFSWLDLASFSSFSLLHRIREKSTFSVNTHNVWKVQFQATLATY